MFENLLPFAPPFAFIVGIVLQSIILLGKRVQPRIIQKRVIGVGVAAALIAAAIAFAASRMAWMSAALFLIVYPCTFVFGFREYLMPRIGSHSLLVWNTLLICVWFTQLPISPLWALPLILFTLCNLAFNFFDHKAPLALRSVFYGAFLIMLIATAGLQFEWVELKTLFTEAPIAEQIITALFLGMNAIYLLTHAALFDFIPKSSNRKSKKKQIYEEFMNTHFVRWELDGRITSALIIAIAALFLGNYYWQMLSQTMLVSIIITALSFFPIVGYYEGYPSTYKGKRETTTKKS